ncbi:MAG TPA: 30S ribosomal protein S8 [Patescibacteria group bacterium]|nr:30S ribosomal protein S8 [Patescibacteria group bacterium]
MYTIGDFLIQVKNGYQARKKQLVYPHSNVVASIAAILEKEGFVGKIKTKTEKFDKAKRAGSKVTTEKKFLEIDLKYTNRMPAIVDVKIVSKPSVHHYVGRTKLKTAVSRHGMGIVSTSKGIMTSREATKTGVGGELIAQIF